MSRYSRFNIFLASICVYSISFKFRFCPFASVLYFYVVFFLSFDNRKKYSADSLEGISIWNEIFTHRRLFGHRNYLYRKYFHLSSGNGRLRFHLFLNANWSNRRWIFFWKKMRFDKGSTNIWWFFLLQW